MVRISFKVVPDTNVVVASEKSTRSTSPNKELFERWRNGEFELLYSDDTLLEYIEKIIRALLKLGREVRIEFYHLPLYPIDPDDIAFLLCAENGEATHLVSYDTHLKDIAAFYSFKVCKPLNFLFELRRELTKK